MILLTARDICRQFDVDPVLNKVSFDVRPGERIALIGPNGAGKTTLLNILARRDEPDSGSVEVHQSADLALLEQQPEFAPERTLLEEARTGLAHLYELQRDAADVAARMGAERDSRELERLHRRYDALQQELARLDAFNIEHRVDEVLTGLGFERADYERPLATFSGGQQSRAVLARLLLRAPELMLLDEPTNHLDIAAIEWLEDFLGRSTQAVILVSHDRYFLDRVTTRVLELHWGRITDYRGNFTAYWSQREERNKVARRTWEKQQEFIAKTEDYIRRNKYGQKSAQAKDREKKLDRVELVDVAPEITAPPMSFGQPSRTGDWVIEANGVTKGFGEPLFREVTLQVLRGERIGIFGPNGAGKTTLLRTLLGELQPDSGSVRLGTGVEIAYFDQQLSSVDPEADALEAIRPPDVARYTDGQLRDLLARFGVRGEQAVQRVGQMSGGERSKVALARLAALNANVLVLDEPTNHLDLWSRDSLESALKEFDGTILFVSHDRYFLDRVSTSLIVLTPERWWQYDGNYSGYVAFLKSRAAESGESAPSAGSEPQVSKPDSRAKAKESRRKRRFPFRKVEDLEAEIAETEGVVSQCQADLADPEVHRDGERVKQTMQRYEQARLDLAQLYEHWEEAIELN